MSNARRDNRRELKLVLMRDLAEVAIRCKNGGRTLRNEETNDITDTVSRLYLRARDDEPELKRVLMTAKGCKGAVPDAAMKQLETLYDFLGSVASGGCGEAFVQDCARYARHIVDSNPDNAVLQRAWTDGNYATRLAQAKVEGENELAEYLKRPAQRQPQDLSEALGFLAYHSASMDEEDWKDLIVDAVKESFKEMAKKDSYRASMLGTWAENLDKFTFKKALKQCVKDYPNLRREAEGRLKQLS